MYYVFLIRTNLETAIKYAVKQYYTRHRRLPAAIVVNPRLEAEARAAVSRLELNVPVRTLGGCLVWEVWLEAEQHEKEEVTA